MATLTEMMLASIEKLENRCKELEQTRKGMADEMMKLERHCRALSERLDGLEERTEEVATIASRARDMAGSAESEAQRLEGELSNVRCDLEGQIGEVRSELADTLRRF